MSISTMLAIVPDARYVLHPMEHDLIAALATPFASGALAVIRTSGDRCIESLALLTDRPDAIAAIPGGRIKRATVIDPDSGLAVDEVVIAVFRGPHSYTGEDVAEISCHGSVPGIRRILDILFRNGFRPADPGEFTQRAFLAGKIDLTRAEAVQEIVSSQTAVGHEMALRRLGGSIEATVRGITDDLVQIMARVAIQLDYPEEETGEIPIDPKTVAAARARLSALAGSYRTGRLYQEGVSVAIAGQTNAGKSSLFNAFLKEDRAIVSDIHGTTRDYISSRVDFRGIPVEIYDTAGLRETSETIEEEGIRRTRTVVRGTDVVVYLVDGTTGMTAEDDQILAELGWDGDGPTSTASRLIPVWNKIDVPGCKEPPPVSGGSPFSRVSATTMEGVDALVERIVAET
jgi:tRNA modification GTPase